MAATAIGGMLSAFGRALLPPCVCLVVALGGLAASAQDRQEGPRFIFRDGQIIEVEPGSAAPDGMAPGANDPMAPIQPLRVITIGYLPIVPAAPLFVMMGENWGEEMGYRLELRRYLDAQKMARALTAQEIDAAYVDIGPLLTERSRGSRIQVIAAGALGGVRVVARGNATAVIQRFDDAAPGMRDFVKIEGREIRIASTHRSSPAYIGLDAWLRITAELQPYQYRLRGLSLTRLWYYANLGRGANPRVDIVVLPEPLISALIEKDPTAAIIMEAQRFMRNQPASVMAVHSDVVEDERPTAQDLVSLHIRAVKMLTAEPEATLDHVRRWADFVPVSDEYLPTLLDPAGIRFVSDPREIADATLTMHNALFREHVLENKVNINQLINTTYYDQAVLTQ